MSLVKLGVAAAAASPFVKVFTELVVTPVWGIPISVAMAALTGAGLSLFFGDPIESRRSLWGQLAAATVFGLAIADLTARALKWEWATANMPMFALMTAALLRWFLPSIIDRGKEFIKDFKFSFTKKPEDEGEGK